MQRLSQSPPPSPSLKSNKSNYRSQWRSHFPNLPLLSGLGAAIVGGILFATGVYQPLERVAYQGLFLARQTLAPLEWDDRIVVIAIDGPSLETYGSFPWPRAHYADLLKRLAFVQPAAVGLDILMPESTDDDAQLAEQILLNGTVVMAVGDDGTGNAIQVTPTLTQPAQGFFRLGHVKHTPDGDGISRQAMLYEIQGQQTAPSLSIALVQTYHASLENTLSAEPISFPDLNPDFIDQPQRFDQHHPVWINWPGQTRPVPDTHTSVDGLMTVSYRDVMADDSPLLGALQNKIVLLGYTATGVAGNTIDALRTPFEPRIPTAGVYIHAALVDNLLNDRFLQPLPRPWAIALIMLTGLGSALALKPLGLRLRLAALAGGLVLWAAIAVGSFAQNRWLPVVAPMGTGLLSLVGIQFSEQRERQTLRDLFAINLSPEMAEFIWQHKGELLTEGQIRPQTLTATLLFMDIRNFTTLSENLPSEVLLPWLNRYFEVMTDCIMAHGGVVDKYIGDAIMAAFGAPLPRSAPDAVAQDAQAAVQACADMVATLAALNQEFVAEGLPTVRFGIGLHTGTLVTGTVGSRARASYSLFGDTVNIAARLQDLTKQLAQDTPYPVLMSEATYTHVCDRWAAIPKGRVQLRGRSQETRVYALGHPKATAL